MHGIRTSFAAIAVLLLIIWLASAFLVMSFTAPLAGPDRYLEISAMAGRLVFSANTGKPQGTAGWGAGISSLEPVRERTRI